MEFTNTTTAETEVLPPPYEPPAENIFGDGDDEEEEEEGSPLPTTYITINAPTSIHGSHNVVSVATMDASRLAAILVSTMNQKIAQASLAGGRQSNYNIQLNCGVTVVGDKNVIGNVGMRPRALAAAQGSGSSTSPAAEDAAKMIEKRKASEEPEDSPEPKRIEADTVAGSVPSPTS